MAGHQPERDLSTTVLGIPISLPVLISPTGVQAVDPEGEVAVARAAAARGTIMGLSSFASKPVEQVVDANREVLRSNSQVGGCLQVRRNASKYLRVMRHLSNESRL